MSRTPLRVSLFGGGTDYPDWFRRRRGAVLGFTIDRYIYISALPLTSFVDYRYRLAYSRVETGREIADIAHPLVRAALEHEGYDEPFDCSIQSDLPANAGLGSSSAFAVGFVHLLAALRGTEREPLALAREAIYLEQERLHERVGVQDQLHAAFGGLNRFDFEGDAIERAPIPLDPADAERLARWMVLVYTGIKRHASSTLEEQLANTAQGRVDGELAAMLDLVDAAQRLFGRCRGDDLPRELATLLAESWRLKQRLSSRITNAAVDALYARCLEAGALAGKLCGAGAGGFLLMIVPPDRRTAFVEAIGAARCIDFRLEFSGSTTRRTW